MEEQAEGTAAYGKRPLWQWILLYVVIGGVIYAAIYALFLHKQNPYSNNKTSASAAKPAVPTQPKQNTIYKLMSKGKLGMVMTDPKGMTLYTYAKDTAGVSNCIGNCLKNWPAYTAGQHDNLPANVSVITRTDGTMQYAWKGMPLYYFVKDSDSGDAYGDGVGGLWSVIKQ